jgi:hypothetical protein
MSEVRITVQDDGKLEFIYDDALADLLTLGPSVTVRASEVEPCAGGWQADMRRQDGCTILGPFPLRQQAIDAEVAWLRTHRGL